MLRYLFTLATLLNSKSEIRKHYSPGTVISDLFDDDLDEIDFIKSLSELELVYGFEIPDELYDRTDLTLGEFAEELSQLRVISEGLYSEFFDIKFTSMKLTKRWIELENKTDDASLNKKKEINKRFDELTLQLNLLLEFDNENYLLN